MLGGTLLVPQVVGEKCAEQVVALLQALDGDGRARDAAGAVRSALARRGRGWHDGERGRRGRAPLRDLNKDEKRSLEQVIRVMDRTVDELTAGAGKGGK